MKPFIHARSSAAKFGGKPEDYLPVHDLMASSKAARVAFSEFFESNPDIDQIVWTQYTPYFNDGDPCIFGVNDMFFTLAKDKVDLSDLRHPDDEENCHGTYYYGENDPIASQRKKFSNFVKQIGDLPDEIFLSAFDDHVRVVASKNGFDTQEYDHD